MSLLSLSVNGVPDAMISPLDRGFGYGDGLFETCRCVNGQIPLWSYHRDRLLDSAARLSIPVDERALQRWLNQSLGESATVENSVVKIQITRGDGGRGYRMPAAASPTCVVALFAGTPLESIAFTEGIDVRICKMRLGKNPALAGIKHLNRLEQVIARSEWSEEYAEGLLLDSDGNLIEATASNIFIVKDGVLITPDLSTAGVAGVMRRVIIEVLAPTLRLPVQITTLGVDDLVAADEVFLTNSVFGIWPVKRIAGMQLDLGQRVTRILQKELLASGVCGWKPLKM